MAKGGITWDRRNEDGSKTELHAQLVGNEWRFSHRAGRYDEWRPLPTPLQDDWLELEDAVERRVIRQLMKPEQLARLRSEIKRRFPGAGKWMSQRYK